MSRWHKYDIADVALEFGTDIKNGKTNIKHDRKRRGNNNVFLLPAVDSKNTVKKLTSDGALLLLAVVYCLTAFIGNYLEALLGLTFLFSVFSISLAIKYASSKRVVNSYHLLLPSAKVVENGSKIRLSAFDVEIGDLIEFSQGDIIPADARIVLAENLKVSERYIDPITGRIAYRREEKSSEALPYIAEDMDTYANVVYAASMVVSGKGSAIVTEIGADTKLSANKTGLKIISDNDAPEYFLNFYASAKRTSLIAFLTVIPLTFVALIRKSPISPESGRFDLLYAFLLLLAVSVTCMSELIIATAESLVTKELLISSRKDKAKKNTDSRITKLSSAENIADTDTVLILSPEVLIDNRHLVRRIFFADKSYRFDTLKSDDLSAFYTLIIPILAYSNKEYLSKDMIAVKAFFEENDFAADVELYSKRPRFLRNFPTEGARACVFETDANGKPSNCIFYTNNLALVAKCSDFRTEGGGLWKIESSVSNRIYSKYNEFKKVGLSPILFISLNENRMIFEGIVGVGKEYPFADGNLAEEFAVSAIQPILFLEKENQSNLTALYECGFIASEKEVSLASEYLRNGMEITDAPIATKAYVGFDREDVSKITDRLLRNGRKVLPVIKDSVERSGISPLSVYAAHSTESYDSIKISSSLLLRPADADARKGGAFDILKMIRGSSMARLKLGVYKNYLAFSMFLRSVAICCSLLIGKSGSNITSLMILTLGFVCDAIAVISLMMSKGIPVKPKDAAADAKVMFSSTLSLFFSITGILSGILIFAMTEILLSLGKLPISCSSMFLSYSVFYSQLISLSGFLVILNKRTRRRALNWIYVFILAILSSFLIVQNFLPENFYNFFYVFNFYRLEFNLIPFVFLISLIILLAVLLISKLLSSFSSSDSK